MNRPATAGARVRRALLLVAAALLPSAGVAASPGLAVPPGNRTWQGFGLADRVPILGDLADAACPSVTLLRLHADTRLPPHAAPVDRAYLLLSGTLHVGFGKRWDETRMRTLAAGSSWVVPANTSTYEWSEGEAVCQVVAVRAPDDCPRLEEVVVHPTPTDRAGEIPPGDGGRTVLWGSPDLPGCPWVERIRLPPGASAPPGPGSSRPEVAWTVVAGALRRPVPDGTGASAPEELPAGTVAVLPAGARLEGAPPDGAVVLRQFAGSGPPACWSRGSLHPAPGAGPGGR